MKAKDKLRVTWCKVEKTLQYHTPAGTHTKPDGHYMHGVIDDSVAKELDERGYDITTLKFSIEPKKGNKDFESQRKKEICGVCEKPVDEVYFSVLLGIRGHKSCLKEVGSGPDHEESK